MQNGGSNQSPRIDRDAQAIEDFVKRLIVYHPLDQPLVDASGSNQAIKHLKIIENLKKLGHIFTTDQESFRYDDIHQQYFKDIYIDAKEKVMELGEQEMDEATNKGKNYKGNLQDIEDFKSVNMAMKLFCENNMHVDTRRYLYEFVNYYEEQTKFIKAK